MPANFSAVNAEVVYGGAVADYLPNAWTAANVKQFSTNVITLVSNSFQNDIIKATLGTMFGGNWGGDGAGSSIFSADKGGLGSIVKYGISGKTTELNSFNKFMQVVGLSAAVYQLGTADAKSYVKETKILGTKGKF